MIRIPVRLSARPSLEAEDLDANFSEILSELNGGLSADNYAPGMRLSASQRVQQRSAYVVSVPIKHLSALGAWETWITDPTYDLGNRLWPDDDEKRDLFGMYKKDTGAIPVITPVEWALLFSASGGSTTVSGSATLRHVGPVVNPEQVNFTDTGSFSGTDKGVLFRRALSVTTLPPGRYNVDINLSGGSFTGVDFLVQLTFKAQHVR